MGITLVNFTACNSEAITDEIATSQNANLMVECENYGESLKQLVAGYDKDTTMLYKLYDYDFTLMTRGNVTLTEEEEKKVSEITAGVVESSEQILKAFDIKDAVNLTEEEKMVVAMLLYADYMDNHSIAQTRGGAITGNHYVDCALSALGITALTDIASEGIENYVKKKGTKALLRTVGKFAGKSLSVVGWGLAAYDFATCV